MVMGSLLTGVTLYQKPSHVMFPSPHGQDESFLLRYSFTSIGAMTPTPIRMTYGSHLGGVGPSRNMMSPANGSDNSIANAMNVIITVFSRENIE